MFSRQLLPGPYRWWIGYSPDKMLQARLLSYPDAQRYRLGTNYEQIPVNRCPFATNNTTVTDRYGWQRWENPNYFPNSFDDIQIDQAYKEPFEVNSHYADYDRNCEEEKTPGNLFKIMSAEQQQNTINNI
jgi:catalase